jgi:hypothetical protein
MKTNMKNKFLVSLLSLVVVSACTYDFPEATEPTTGATDFTKIVSVGGSLTAGHMNGAIYATSQQNSFANILATQARSLNGGDFNQPDFTVANGCFNPTGGCTLGRLSLKLTSCNPSDPTVVPTPGPANRVGDGTATFAFDGNKANLNNFGVGGATLGAGLSPAFSANPYYARIASNMGTSTLIGDAAAALGNNGTFFTFWAGNDDILTYATNGGTGSYTLADQTPMGFSSLYNTSLNAMLTAKPDAEGAVANIPDLTSLPYFSTLNPLSFNVPVCSRPALTAGIDQLNAAINGWNAGVDANGSLTAEQKAALKRPVLSKSFDSYPLIILDLTLSDAQVPTDAGPFTIPKIRNAVVADGILICLSAGSAPTALPAGMGISPANPINEGAHDAFYLTKVEQEEIQGVISAYNAVIATAVNANSTRLVLVDVNAALQQVKAGTVTINGSSITASITPPFGGFSLDGVHPNARGNAYIANLFITAINAKFGSDIPLSNPNDYKGNELPVLTF